MTTDRSPELVPNHHGDHPGFSGVRGFLLALNMTVGREQDAALAAELVGLEPGDRVVDIGCGPGTAVRRAARLGASATGVDPAAVMLRVARALGTSDRVRYVEGRAEALPLEDGAATVAWSIATVHHWPDLDGGLAEVRRVLAPGGRFVAIERKTTPGATGLASHGWIDAQAEAFGAACTAAGFVEAKVVAGAGRRGPALAVVARRA